VSIDAGEGYPELALLVDGEWLGLDGRGGVDVVDPATGRSLGQVPRASTADLDRALEAARRAFRAWRATAPDERAGVLARAADLLRARRDSIARTMTLEEGKTFAESCSEVDFTAGIVDFLAGEAFRTSGRVVPTAAGRRRLVLREPVGPVAAFTPWNYPLTVPARKVAAALAGGSTVVLKAAEETPATALELARALVDAGLPDGVLNVVFGDPAHISSHLIRSPITRMVSFTGSTAVGKHLAGLAAEGAKRTTLELGGHAPVLVFDDVDIDAVASAAVGSKFHNSGQSCGSPARFYVHERIHDRFVERFADLAGRLRVGSGLDPDVDMEPLASRRRVSVMEGLVSDAVDHGADLVLGGSSSPGEGFGWQPTLLGRVPGTAVLMAEEPFGPIAVTSTFSTVDEAVTQANRLPYGLAAYVFTGSLETAARVPHEIEAGMVSVNAFDVGGVDTFFGGVKESGYGSDGGPEAVESYLVHKLVTSP
jgi:succinate-semialdehyde dehydrogenase/glutarate-semialdehyde dehydrogenase